MASLTGTKLGNYEVKERIARGGMAEVYRGYHPRLDREVAIKVLHAFLAEGEDFLARFEREAQAVAQLRHPGIVQVHDFGGEDDLCYMIMEYVDGATLAHWIRATQGRARAPEILSIIEQIAAPLDFAHGQGIIHRDIKPSNIMLNKQGEAFLTDFGIARMVSSTQFTATGTLIGTPAYMSPEQCRGEELTQVSDIYALGVILYEMLTGHQPYEAETPLSILQKHITEPVPTLRRYDATLPTAYERIIQKAMHKDSMERYETATEMAEDLAKAVAESLAPTKGAGQTAPQGGLEETQKSDLTLSRRPTVVMEEDEEEDTFAGLADEAVEEVVEEVAEEAVEELRDRLKKEEPEPEPEPEISETQSEMPAKTDIPTLESMPEEVIDLKPAAKKLPLGVIIGAGLAIVTVVLLIVLDVIPLGGADCVSFDECLMRAHEAWEAEDLWGADDYYDAAISKVYPGEEPEHRFLWCERAELMRQLDEPEVADEYQWFCEEW